MGGASNSPRIRSRRLGRLLANGGRGPPGERRRPAAWQKLWCRLHRTAVKLERAKLELERAKAKLKALGPFQTGDRSGTAQTTIPSDQAPLDDSQIVWGPKDTDRIPASAGEPIGSVQIGHRVEPKKAVYAPGDVLTVKLFFKHTGKQPVRFGYPRSEILERIGLNVVLRSLAGEKLNWGWGPAHKQPAHSGNNLVDLSPGDILSLPAIKILIGPAELVGESEEPQLFAFLDVKPGQAAQLFFKPTGNPAQGGLWTLETRPFEFRVEESPPTRQSAQ